MAVRRRSSKRPEEGGDSGERTGKEWEGRGEEEEGGLDGVRGSGVRWEESGVEVERVSSGGGSTGGCTGGCIKHAGCTLRIWIDGAARGNPGRASYGVFVTDINGHKVRKIAPCTGI